MDEHRIDQLARLLDGVLPRRRAFPVVASGALGLLLGRPVHAGPTLGKRRCGKRKCKKVHVCFKKKCRKIPVAGQRCYTGLPCRNGAICVATGLAGDQVCDCPAGTNACGAFPQTECVNLRTDPFHCGRCLNRCLAGTTTCCAVGLLEPGACVDTDSDPRHCGGCGRSCGSGERCLGGDCVSTCRAGLTDCNSSCVDTNTDSANCGTCGNACGADTTCINGQCQAACVPYGEACSTASDCCLLNDGTHIPCSGGLCRFN